MTYKVGDKVTRMLGGSIPINMVIDKIEDGIITASLWTFDEETGAEVDEYLDWGPPPKHTGSFIIPRKHAT